MKALERRLGLFAVVAISMSAMLGAIFVVPGVAAALTGPSLWLAFVAAAICILPAAFSKSELATAMPTSGGSYVYIDRAFGPVVGTVFGLGLWLSLMLKSSFALIGFGAYLTVIAEFPIQIAGLILLVIITGLNIGGVKAVKKFQVPSFVVALAGLLILVGLGVEKSAAPVLSESFTKGTEGFVLATAFVFAAFAGVTKIAAVAEEVKDPDRNLPYGMLISLFAITIVFSLVVFMMVSTVPDLHTMPIEAVQAPVYLMAESIGGEFLGTAAAILAIFSMLAMANVGLLASSRFPFAMSRGGLLPDAFGKISERYVTPVFSILFTSGLMAIAITLLDIVKIVKLASVFKILVFMAVNAAVIVLRSTKPQWYRPTYKSPWYPWVQIFGILTAIGLLVLMGTIVITAIVAIGSIGLAAYFLYGRKHVEREGQVGKLATSPKWLKQPAELDDVLPSQANVAVPLFGDEHSPEMLIEMGAALADGKKVEVIHVKEVPEQTDLGAMVEDSALDSLKRRINALKEEQNIDLEFDAVVSRDVAKSLYYSAQRITCEWMVMEWTPENEQELGTWRPKDWLLHHMPCNIATFKDAGIRYIREIMVTVEDATHEDLVVSTADHLAVTYGAELTFVQHMPAGLPESEVEKRVAFVEELRANCLASTHTLIVHGKDEVQALAKEAAGYDLMVTTAPWGQGFLDRFKDSKADKLTRLAPCSVLRLS